MLPTHYAQAAMSGTLLRVEVVRQISVVVDGDSGHAYPQRDGLDVHQRTLCP